MVISSQKHIMAAAIVVVLCVSSLAGPVAAWMQCPSGYKDCDQNSQNGCETCVKTDVNNCGGCNHKCPTYPNSSPTCSGGNCGYQCSNGWKNCDSNSQNGCEADVSKDVNNCGGCGMTCPTYPNSVATCSGGKCGYTCTSGWKNCDGKKENGCETDVGKDVNNCGGCGNKCPCTDSNAVAICSNGVCGTQCKSGCKYDNYQKKCLYSH